MINRDNYFAVQKYLAYRRQYDQISDSSARLEESWLRHLLEWAGSRSFAAAPKIKPPFPAYLLDARRDGKDKPMSEAYLSKVVRAAVRFLRWLRLNGTGYSSLTPAFFGTLKPPRRDEMPTERKVISLEEVRAMAAADVLNLREERIRAAAAFLFLSGIRVGAFTTLTLETVNINRLEVKQWPKNGVRTKNGKHATTYLLNIPDLLEVVRDWDSYLRRHLPPSGLWFAPLCATTGELNLDATVDDIGEHRHVKVRRDLRQWCERVGLPYYSPHKFRHGHATYSLQQANDVGDLKAISQNLMHSSIKVTDAIYAVLERDTVKERIVNLGQAGSRELSTADMASRLRALAAELEASK